MSSTGWYRLAWLHSEANENFIKNIVDKNIKFNIVTVDAIDADFANKIIEMNDAPDANMVLI